MVAILQFELRVTTFPERRLCGVCLDQQRWTPISGLTFATSGKPASLFFAHHIPASGCDAREEIAAQPAKRLLYAEGDILRCRKESLPHAFVVTAPCRCATSGAALRFTSSSSTGTHHLLQQSRGTGTFRTTECTVSRQFIVGPYPFG
jgi:hypothetical protein